MDTAILSLLEKYKELLKRRPLETKAVTSCAIGALGEGIGSYIKSRKTGKAEDVRDLAKRIAVIGMYGLLVIGPTFHWWYGKLEELTAELPERFRFIAKLLIDRIIFTPPFLVATLFYRKLFERSSMPEKVAELQRIFLSVLIVNWKVWTIVQGVNLTIVPIEYRALFGNVCALWWNIYLALFA